MRIAAKRLILGSSGLAIALLLSACTFGSVPAISSVRPSASVHHASSTSQTPVDPLTQITDPHSSEYVNSEIQPVLHVKGTGPHSYSISAPADDVQAIRFFVSCAPDTDFKLTMTTVTKSQFYSGGCPTRFANTGTVPLPPGNERVAIELDVPAGIDFWLLAIPIY
jgi:hypothetical protein